MSGTLTLSHFLSLGAILFALSVIGIFLNRRNLIVLLMAIELMLLAVNMNFIAFSYYLGDMAGQVFVFFILTVAAAESAIRRAAFSGPRAACMVLEQATSLPAISLSDSSRAMVEANCSSLQL